MSERTLWMAWSVEDDTLAPMVGMAEDRETMERYISDEDNSSRFRPVRVTVHVDSAEPCRCVREDGSTRFNINCTTHGKRP